MSERVQARIPFSNGTEERAWVAKWCDYCAHDHMMHGTDGHGPGCDILIGYMLGVHDKDWRWPEAWLPEPDDGQFALPSRMCCLMFTPCEPCGGDPGELERAERVAQVEAYWRSRWSRSGATTEGKTDG